MVGASKILTVSYGTFSCTLEGFDDPFSTMRSIAEYFRDLAADDRYFGAEPPTPDAEMLHRIAEKEIHRRVEARVSDTGIVLKQLDREAQAPAAKAAPAMDEQPRASQDEAAFAPAETAFSDYEDEDGGAATEDLPQAAELEEAPTPVEDQHTAETVAEKLSRIRAVVSSARLADTAEAAPAVDTDDLSDALDSDDAGFEDDATEDDIAEALSAFDAEDDGDAEETAFVEETAPVEEHAQDRPEEAQEMADEAPVAQDETGDAVMADAVDEDAEDMGEDDAGSLDDSALAETADDNSADAEEEDDSALAATTDGDDVLAEAEETAEEGHDEAWVAELDGAEEEVAEDHGAVEETAEMPEPIGRVVKLSRDEFEAEQDAWDDAEEADEAPEALTEDDTAEGWAAHADDAEEDEAEDWDAFDEDEPGMADLDEDEADETGNDAAGDDLPEAAESDLEEEDGLTAGIRAALGSATEDATALDHAEVTFDEDDTVAENTDRMTDDDRDDALLAGELAARDRLGALAEPEGDAADVDRLLEKTNSQLEESEGSRRRSAIAHLKAAVAATKADRLLKRVTSREQSEAEEQTQYRDDLAQVVRPRRPVDGGESQSERPRPIASPSPLMLVSEQRVDGDGGSAGITPIRPRRIMHDEDADLAADAESSSYEDSASFAEFAEKMGASELPDLLEAAAAYAAYVENRPHFSRPQLMKRVARHDASGEFSREAGLRSFGQLLRQGKIRKLKRGQFTVADTTRFNPEARIAGE